MEQLFKIGELAKQTGLSKRTIDYYTKLGLLPVAQTAASGYRYYDSHSIELIHHIERLKAVHLPLEEIKQYLCENSTIQGIEEKLRRLEMELASLKPDQLHVVMQQLAAKHPVLFSMFLTVIGDL